MIEVTDGDVDLWYQASTSALVGLSRPDATTNAGFICGWDSSIFLGQESLRAGFILSPKDL